MPMIRRRRPLLRTAVAGGAAYKMGQRAAEKRASSEPGEAPAPAAPAATTQGGGMTPEATSQLKAIADLHERGVLTDAEFEQQKQALLGSS
jgi:hypothetical protein